MSDNLGEYIHDLEARNRQLLAGFERQRVVVRLLWDSRREWQRRAESWPLPCRHYADQVGLVVAIARGDLPSTGVHSMSVATCPACYIRTRGWLQMRSGLIPDAGIEVYPRLADQESEILAAIKAVGGGS